MGDSHLEWRKAVNRIGPSQRITIEREPALKSLCRIHNARKMGELLKKTPVDWVHEDNPAGGRWEGELVSTH